MAAAATVMEPHLSAILRTFAGIGIALVGVLLYYGVRAFVERQLHYRRIITGCQNQGFWVLPLKRRAFIVVGLHLRRADDPLWGMQIVIAGDEVKGNPYRLVRPWGPDFTQAPGIAPLTPLPTIPD
jgi:hypothetical protein